LTALTYDIEDMLSLKKVLSKWKIHKIRYHTQIADLTQLWCPPKLGKVK
tara:strand:- start:6638 stop:6784 length:147 start_codon:yes stop_codon:yes gene_type:complete